MNINNPQTPKEKSEGEKLFDSLLFCRQLASLSVERLRITKELERLMPEDQAGIASYLTDTICLYEKECEVVLDIDEDDPIPEGFKDDYCDKNTTLVQYLYAKRMLILTYLQEINMLRNKGKEEEVTEKIKETHIQDVTEISNAKKRIENDFPLLENMTMTAIKDSSDNQKNEILKKSLDKMRSELRNDGFNV